MKANEHTPESESTARGKRHTAKPSPKRALAGGEHPDRDLVILAAENIMGWTHRPRPTDDEFQMWQFARPDACNIFASPLDLTTARWWPLTEIADAFMLVDALLKKRMWFRLSSPLPEKPDDPNWQATFQGGSVNHPDRCRAIVLACLAAVQHA